MYIKIYMYIHTCACTYLYKHIIIYMCVYIYIYMRTCIYMYINIFKNAYIYTYAYGHVHSQCEQASLGLDIHQGARNLFQNKNKGSKKEKRSGALGDLILFLMFVLF